MYYTQDEVLTDRAARQAPNETEVRQESRQSSVDLPKVEQQTLGNFASEKLLRNLATEKKFQLQCCTDEYTQTFTQTIGQLENQKGRPVYFIEIYQALVKVPGTEAMRNGVAQLFNFFKDDRVLCDAEMNLYSLNPRQQRTP